MPTVMSLEGPRLAPWAQIHNDALTFLPRPFWRASATLEAARRDDPKCCWNCPCESNYCCDGASPTSRAFATAMRVMAPKRKALRGITDGFKLHPFMMFGGLFLGCWLGGTKSGQAFVKRVNSGGFDKAPKPWKPSTRRRAAR